MPNNKYLLRHMIVAGSLHSPAPTAMRARTRTQTSLPREKERASELHIVNSSPAKVWPKIGITGGLLELIPNESLGDHPATNSGRIESDAHLRSRDPRQTKARWMALALPPYNVFGQ